jgi:alkylation response protein AidB-like acyl-CoA dehydrogenase
MFDDADSGLTEEERAMVEVVARFVDERVRPVVRDLEHNDTYPAALIDEMKELGVFGLLVPAEYGGVDVSTRCLALVTEQLARGWMSLAGAMGGHSVICFVLRRYGTPAQRERYLPRMATGELRVAMALTEPSGGSDLQAITTTARPDGDGYLVNGSKTWISNARRAGTIAVLCKTDPAARPAHRGISLLLVDADRGYEVSRDLPKLGYKGVEACEVNFVDVRVGGDALLGGVPGEGFAQMMHGLEVGRIQVAARALGVARAAFDDALAYSQTRETFGQPIWRHQSVGSLLANMATSLHAARLVTLDAARRIDAGQRADLEAGMAKLLASETCLTITQDALRVHGGYGYSREYDVERYYRDAPLMIVGEGTNEIQRNVIARQLVARARSSL